MMKRSGKFYRKNEADVMRSLGLEPTMNSGSGWIEKEDGQSEDVICQLKSTDSTSVRIQQKDLQTLEYNAGVCHKLPVFAIQFLNTDDVYLMVKPELLQELARYIETGDMGQLPEEFLGLDLGSGPDFSPDFNSCAAAHMAVKSSAEARANFTREWETARKKGKKSAL